MYSMPEPAAISAASRAASGGIRSAQPAVHSCLAGTRTSAKPSGWCTTSERPTARDTESGAIPIGWYVRGNPARWTTCPKWPTSSVAVQASPGNWALGWVVAGPWHTNLKPPALRCTCVPRPVNWVPSFAACAWTFRYSDTADDGCSESQLRWLESLSTVV